MGKISLDFLFTNQRATKPTREWSELLEAGKDSYANCRVVSFTRVKNLNSDWKHEYVQFIVEEESTKERARVYAERGNEKDLDWVTFGPTETITSGSKGLNDLPIPLTSLVFGGPWGTDVDKRPTIGQIAEILAATTLVGGGYEFYGHSCFWFAFTSYDAVKRQFGKWATEKAWRWFNFGGAGGGGFKDAVGLGWPMMFKWCYVGDANAFKKERETNMDWYDDGEGKVQIIDQSAVQGKVASNLEGSAKDEYISQMEGEGISIDRETVDNILNKASKEYQGVTVNFTEEFEKLNDQLVSAVKADPDAARFESLYDSYEVPVELLSFQQADGRKAEYIDSTTKALQVVVGKILEEAQRKAQ